MNTNCKNCYKFVADISCNYCPKKYCLECYIGSFTRNKGVVICPFCTCPTGSKMSEIEVYMGIKEIRFKHNNRNKRTPCENIIDAIDKSSFLREETKNSFINFVKHVEEIESNISSSEVLKDLKDKWSEEGGIRSGVIYFVMEDDHVVIEKMIGKQDNLFLLKLWNDYVKRMEALRKELRIVGEGRVKIAEDIMKHCTPAKKTDCETRKVNPSYGVKCHKCKQIFPISRTKFKKYNRVIRCRFCNKENKYVQNDLKTL